MVEKDRAACGWSGLRFEADGRRVAQSWLYSRPRLVQWTNLHTGVTRCDVALFVETFNLAVRRAGLYRRRCRTGASVRTRAVRRKI